MRGEFEITDIEFSNSYLTQQATMIMMLDHYAKQAGGTNPYYGYYAYKYYSDRKIHHFRWADQSECVRTKLIEYLKENGFQTANTYYPCGFSRWLPEPAVEAK